MAKKQVSVVGFIILMVVFIAVNTAIVAFIWLIFKVRSSD